MKDKSLKLLYIAPETLLRTNDYDELWFLDFLKTECSINHIALDECHAVVQSSQDFRPKYRQLGILKEYFEDIPFTCLTATATKDNIQEITSLLGMTDYTVFDHHLYRPNLHQNVIRKIDEMYQLMSLLRQYTKTTTGLIYCNTREKCKEISDYLNKNGYNTAYFYSTIGKKEKKRILDGFIDGSISKIICTSAFGTGINKDNVRFVINLDVPASLNDYVQQAGRSGRDGLVSNIYTFYHPSDITKLKYILRMSTTSPIRLRKSYEVLDEVVDYCLNTKQCRNQLLLQAYNQTLEKDCGTCDNCKN